MRDATIFIQVNRCNFIGERVAVLAFDDCITQSCVFEVGAKLLRWRGGEKEKLAATCAMRGARKQHRIYDTDNLWRAENVKFIEDCQAEIFDERIKDLVYCIITAQV